MYAWSVSSLFCAVVVVGVALLAASVESKPMQQLGMYNMFQFHHGARTAVERDRRATRHHRASRTEPTPRPARHIENTMDAALCKYKVLKNTTELRIPQVIEEIVCETVACKCQSGTFECTQLYTEMEVAYLNADKSFSRTASLNVRYGCVCASESGKSISSRESKK